MSESYEEYLERKEQHEYEILQRDYDQLNQQLADTQSELASLRKLKSHMSDVIDLKSVQLQEKDALICEARVYINEALDSFCDFIGDEAAEFYVRERSDWLEKTKHISQADV